MVDRVLVDAADSTRFVLAFLLGALLRVPDDGFDDDMPSMTNQADNMKARGFAERSGIVVTAGLAKEDLRALSEVKRMSEVEINTVASWSTPPGWRPRTIRGADDAPDPHPHPAPERC